MGRSEEKEDGLNEVEGDKEGGIGSMNEGE